MYFFILVLPVFSEIFYSFEKFLNPADIFYPNSWFANPIEPSSNHAQEFVNITIHFSTQIELPIGYYAEMSIVNSFTKSTTVDKFQSKDDDKVLTFTNIYFPSAGSYGPLRIIIFSAKGGQIVASSVSFGGLGILPARPAPNALSVAYVTGESTTISSQTSLAFTFQLAATMQKYDLIRVNVSSNFSINATTNLIWNPKVNGTAYFSASKLHYDSSQTVFYIYGLDQEVPTGLGISFNISNFTNPSYVIDAGVSKWGIDIFRYGTKTITQRFIGYGPQVSTNPGNITVITMFPSNNNILINSIVQYMSLFMTLVFQITSPIPAGGYFRVEFGGIDLTKVGYFSESVEQHDYFSISSDHYYTATEPVNYFQACSLPSQTLVNCPAKTTVPAGTRVLLHLLPYFLQESTASLISVNTYTGLNQNIDSYKSQLILRLALKTDVKLIEEEPYLYFATGLKTSGAEIMESGLYDTGGIVFKLRADESIQKNTIISIKLPIQSGTNQADRTITISTPLTASYQISSSYISDFSTNTKTTTALNLVNNTISITLPEDVKSDQVINMFIYGTSGGKILKFGLPRFSTNEYTKYEVHITYIANLVTYQYSKPFTIYSSPFTVDFKTLCSTSKLAGIPASISFSIPFEYQASSGFTANIRFELGPPGSINPVFGSGLSYGSVYPSSGLPAGSTLTVLENPAYTLSISLTSFVTSTYEFFFPFSEMTMADYYIIGIIYAISSEGFKYEMAYSLQNFLISGSSALTPIILADPVAYPINTVINNYQMRFSLSAAASNSAFGLYFGKGIAVPSTATVTLSSTVLSSKTFYSSIEEFSNSGILGYSLSALKNTAFTLQISSLSMPWYAGTFNISLYLAPTNSLSSDKSCSAHAIYQIIITPKTLSPYSFSPTSSPSFGSIAQEFNISISLRYYEKIQIFSTTAIEVTLSSSIGYTNSIGTLGLGTYSSTISGTSLVYNFGSICQTRTCLIDNDILINLTHLSLPALNLSQTLAAVTSVKLKYGTFDCWTWLNSQTNTSTNFTVGTSYGKSQDMNITLFPNQQGAELVYFIMKVRFTNSIPRGSNITIYGQKFDLDPDAKINTWCSHLLTSVTFANGHLSVINYDPILEGELFQIRKDLSFTLSSNLSMSDNFYIVITYNGYPIIQDDSAVQNQVKYGQSATVQVTNPGLAVSKDNKGELEIYTFSFRLRNDSTPYWTFCIDVPGSYDMHFGDAQEWFPNVFPGVYYLDSSSSMGNIQCIVDHWIISCSGFRSISSGTLIDINIRGYTPSIPTSGNFGLYIIDTQKNLVIAVSQTPLELDFSDVPISGVDLYRVNPEDHTAYSTNYLFSLSIQGNFSVNSAIQFKFPDNYNFNKDNPKPIDCSVRIYNAESIQNISTICKTEDNRITFIFSSEIKFLTLTPMDFNLSGIVTPDSFMSRNTSKFDAFDTVFEQYSIWSTKYFVYTINTDYTKATRYDFKSYMNLNAAYTGFYKQDLLEIQIAEYNPDIQGSTLGGIPGTTSILYPLQVDNDKVKAFKLELIPSEYSGTLKFNLAKFALYPEQPITYFSIKIPGNATLGLYYISWELNETPFSTPRYGNPITLPLYVSTSMLVNITIGNFYYLFPGYNSLPVSISLGEYSPSDSISVIPVCQNNKISFFPSTIVFSSGENLKYFIVSVESSVPVGTKIVISYSISGTDKIGFRTPDPSALVVNQTTDIKPCVITNLHIEGVNVTHAYIRFSLSTPAIITWMIGPKRLIKANPDLLSYSNMSFYTYPLIGNSKRYQKRYSTYVNRLLNALNEISPDISYESYTSSVIEKGEQFVFYSQNFVSAGNHSILLTKILVPEKLYTLGLWLNNSAQTLTHASIDYTHISLPPPYILQMTFATDVNDTGNAAIIIGLSEYFGIEARRIEKFNSTVRQLANQMKLIIYSSPRGIFNASSLLFNISKSDIQSVLNKIKVNTIIIDVSTAEMVKGENVPQFVNVSNPLTVIKDYKLALAYQIDNTGRVCCIIENNPSSKVELNYTDIYYGYGRDGNKAFKYFCVDAVKGKMNTKIWSFSGNLNYTSYLISCTVCNLYPVISQCRGNSSEILSYSIRWISPDISYSTMITVVLMLLAGLV